MPRIYTSASDPIDFCRTCFPGERAAELVFGNVGDGPDGRGNCYGYNAEHPDYEDDEHYKCKMCKRQLTSEDN